jgi:hypothetical protein
MNGPDDLQMQDESQAVGVPPSARILLRVVYIMGIILVLLFLTLVGGTIWKSARKADPKPIVPPAELGLGLPQGTDIRSAEINGDRLVINTGREVIVIDVRKNAIISRIAASP